MPHFITVADVTICGDCFIYWLCFQSQLLHCRHVTWERNLISTPFWSCYKTFCGEVQITKKLATVTTHDYTAESRSDGHVRLIMWRKKEMPPLGLLCDCDHLWLLSYSVVTSTSCGISETGWYWITGEDGTSQITDIILN